MNNKLKDNSHLLDFSKWCEYMVKNPSDIHYNENNFLLSNEEYLGISNFFDYYLVSPNNHYYCPVRDKTYPIWSRSLICDSYENLIEKINRYRSKYEKMFLYMAYKESNNYKVRFAKFFEEWHLKE